MLQRKARSHSVFEMNTSEPSLLSNEKTLFLPMWPIVPVSSCGVHRESSSYRQMFEYGFLLPPCWGRSFFRIHIFPMAHSQRLSKGVYLFD